MDSEEPYKNFGLKNSALYCVVVSSIKEHQQVLASNPKIKEA